MSKTQSIPSLVCPSCGHRVSAVTNTRAREGYIYRRRKCRLCGELFTSTETLVADLETLIKSVDSAQRLRTALNDFLRGGQ